MSQKRKFKWTVEFTVDRTWVEDGFNLCPETVEKMLDAVLAYAYSHERSGKVLSAPALDEILSAQGYKPGKMTKAEKEHALNS